MPDPLTVQPALGAQLAQVANTKEVFFDTKKKVYQIEIFT
jgi:hypothetical protein